jgi:ketol-acid reductoisomerase
MEYGYPPEAVFTELYLSGESSDYMKQAANHGLMNALDKQALPAQYGVLSRYDRFNNVQNQRLMEITLEEIRSGKFAQEWAKEFGADYPRLRQLLKTRKNMDMWELEQQTLEMLRQQRDGLED